MSENLIYAWIRSLSTGARSHLVARVLRSNATPGVTVLLAFSEASGLSAREVAGLLPAATQQAKTAASGLIHASATCSPASWAS